MSTNQSCEVIPSSSYDELSQILLRLAVVMFKKSNFQITVLTKALDLISICTKKSMNNMSISMMKVLQDLMKNNDVTDKRIISHDIFMQCSV